MIIIILNQRNITFFFLLYRLVCYWLLECLKFGSILGERLLWYRGSGQAAYFCALDYLYLHFTLTMLVWCKCTLHRFATNFYLNILTFINEGFRVDKANYRNLEFFTWSNWKNYPQSDCLHLQLTREANKTLYWRCQLSYASKPQQVGYLVTWLNSKMSE